MLKFYGYEKCSTCRKAKKALQAEGVELKEIDITEKPPALSALKKWLKSGQIGLKELLNTSGQEYRKLGMSEKIKSLPENEILKLLSENGRLVKRPIITDGVAVTAGFRDPAAILKAWK